MRYSADLTAGSLKVRESRIIAELLLREAGREQWHRALYVDNLLQTRSPASAKRLAILLRRRLETMGPELWGMVRDGGATVATHACLAAAIKHSPLLGDFLDLTVREGYRLFRPALTARDWEDYLEGCRSRDPAMPVWSASTVDRLRSSVFQILAQAGYLGDSRRCGLQAAHIAPQVLGYLEEHNEAYTLRCIQVAP